MTEPARKADFNILKALCFPLCLPPSRKNKKIYIVIEGSGIPAPNNAADAIYGVFLSRSDATKCMEYHAGYIDTVEGRELIRDKEKAKDEHGNIYIEIVEREISACCKPTY